MSDLGSKQPLLDEQSLNRLLAGRAGLTPMFPKAASLKGRAGAISADRPGSGMEYDELRPFQIGDDPKRIDWRATARSQQTLVRSYLSEFQQPIYLLVDRGASMRFGTERHLKVTQAVRLALTLAGIYHQSGYEVGGILLNPSPRGYNASHNLDALRQFALELASACPPIEPSNLDWRQIFALLKELTPQGAKLILLSDFLDLNAPAAKMLGELAQHRDVRAICVRDPMELQPPSFDALRLDWGRQSISTHSGTQSTQLLAAIETHQKNLLSHFARSGVELSELLTSVDKFSDDWLRSLL